MVKVSEGRVQGAGGQWEKQTKGTSVNLSTIKKKITMYIPQCIIHFNIFTAYEAMCFSSGNQYEVPGQMQLVESSEGNGATQFLHQAVKNLVERTW